MKNIISALLVLVACTTAWGQQNINGKITDIAGKPIAGAHVVIEGSYRLAVSNEQGDFILSKVSSGKYLLNITHIGFENQSMDVEVKDKPIEVAVLLIPASLLTDEVIITATRAGISSPMSQTLIDSEEIEKLNLGQDLPYLLNFTPSIVTTSDAGAGIGYTSMRIRGSDQSRINVTINGIALNDSESQGVFYVNMPDFSSSLESVQIQRGVGTSTNGPGAFGASVNLQTNTLRTEPFGEVNLGYGSFNTQKYNVLFGSGLIKNHWSIDGRLSYIKSDGFVDRGSSDLKSFYLAGGYHSEKTNIKLFAFSGKEVTYQSWYGVPESRLNNDSLGMLQTAANEGMNEEQLLNLLNSNARTYNFYTYDNQVDDYQQSHYQLHINHDFNKNWQVNLAGHYTRGLGFFEQFRYNDRFSNYNLNNVTLGDTTISRSDLVRKRWLDNHYYGGTFSLQYRHRKLEWTTGGALSRYDGDHFGEVIWAQFASNSFPGDKYYDNKGLKDDFNVYSKLNYRLLNSLSAFVDLQYRTVRYSVNGVDNDLRLLNVNDVLHFFNPKVGATYRLSDRHSFYASYAMANREPTRNDYIDAPDGTFPKPEQMHNVEGGWQLRHDKWSFDANIYLMEYKDQLVLTGELNDVGSPVRTNVDKSFRRGLELQGQYSPIKWFTWMANLSLSQNKIERFTELIYDYTVDLEIVEVEHNNTDISFSPDVVAASQLIFKPHSNWEVALLSKYVGDQFLDNTSNSTKKIEAYFVNDVRLSYSLKIKSMQELGFRLMVNNILNEQYSSNGYTYSYRYEELITQNYFYPQAGTNFMLGIFARF
jgi:iron complex outermembrane recepter protein